MIPEELERFVGRLVDYFGGDVTIILFGSRARGDFNRASDYDLIVVSKRLKGNPLQRTRPLYALNEDFLEVDILAYTPSEFFWGDGEPLAFRSRRDEGRNPAPRQRLLQNRQETL